MLFTDICRLDDSRFYIWYKPWNSVNFQARVALPMCFQDQIAGPNFSEGEGYVTI